MLWRLFSSIRSQFSFSYMFHVVWFFFSRSFNNVAIYARMCVCVCMCQCQNVLEKSIAWTRPLFALPFAFSHYYTLYKKTGTNQIRNTVCYLHGDEQLFRSIWCDNKLHTFIYRFHFLPHSMCVCVFCMLRRTT